MPITQDLLGIRRRIKDKVTLRMRPDLVIYDMSFFKRVNNE